MFSSASNVSSLCGDATSIFDGILFLTGGGLQKWGNAFLTNFGGEGRYENTPASSPPHFDSQKYLDKSEQRKAALWFIYSILRSFFRAIYGYLLFSIKCAFKSASFSLDNVRFSMEFIWSLPRVLVHQFLSRKYFHCTYILERERGGGQKKMARAHLGRL